MQTRGKVNESIRNYDEKDGQMKNSDAEGAQVEDGDRVLEGIPGGNVIVKLQNP